MQCFVIITKLHTTHIGFKNSGYKLGVGGWGVFSRPELPQPELRKGENSVKVPLFYSDARGSEI